MIDGIFLHFVKKELENTLVGFKVIKVLQPEPTEIILVLRNGKMEQRLLIGASPSHPRIYVTSKKEENPQTPPAFCMLLRKVLIGGLISRIDQEGLDRILYIEFGITNSMGDRSIVVLAVELMGRYSNLILTDDQGVIKGAIKVVTEGLRQVVPGQKYEKQRQASKLNLLLDQIYVADDISLTQFVQGLSRESYEYLRLHGMSNSNIVELLQKILRSVELPKPILAVKKDGKSFPFFEVCEPSVQTNLNFRTFSELLNHFFEVVCRNNLIQQKAGNLRRTIATYVSRIENRVRAQTKELRLCENKDQKRLVADLINANLHLISKGQKTITLPNLYDEALVPLTIALSPKLSGAQNAQKYYKEHHKLKVAESKLKELIEEASLELDYLKSVEFNLLQANSIHDIEQIQSELIKQGYLKKHTKNTKRFAPVTPQTVVLESGAHVLFGRNNSQNELLTHKLANKQDLWFHAQKVPGAHVILKVGSEYLPNQADIERAALIAAQNSKAKSSSKVAVDFTQVKNVRKMPNGRPGMVIYTKFKTVYVKP